MPDVENVKKEDLVDVGEKEGAEIELDKKEQKNDGTVISIKPKGSPKT